MTVRPHPNANPVRDALTAAAASLRRAHGSGYTEFLNAMESYTKSEVLRYMTTLPVGDSALTHLQGHYQHMTELLKLLRSAGES
jgi:hypothetical protein